MKIRNPKSRFSLNVNKKYRVLEVGGGHNPHPASQIIVDKFANDNTHRSGDIKVLKHQQFIEGDGENLPFKDKEFDYVICCQVLEHVENPEKFLQEQFRVAKKGYIEIPSLLGERLSPKDSHKWVMHEHNNVLYLVDKSTLDFYNSFDFVELIQDYLPKHSIGFKILERTYPNLQTIRIEWEEDFDYVVSPTDENILRFFKEKWRNEWGNSFFPKRTLFGEFKASTIALFSIFKSVIISKLIRKPTKK